VCKVLWRDALRRVHGHDEAWTTAVWEEGDFKRESGLLRPEPVPFYQRRVLINISTKE